MKTLSESLREQQQDRKYRRLLIAVAIVVGVFFAYTFLKYWFTGSAI